MSQHEIVFSNIDDFIATVGLLNNFQILDTSTDFLAIEDDQITYKLPRIAFYETYLSCKPENLLSLYNLKNNDRVFDTNSYVTYQAIQLFLNSHFNFQSIVIKPSHMYLYSKKEILQKNIHQRIINKPIFLKGLDYKYKEYTCSDNLSLSLTSTNLLERTKASLFYKNEFTNFFSSVNIDVEKLKEGGKNFLEKIIEWQEQNYNLQGCPASYFDLWTTEVLKEPTQNLDQYQKKIKENEKNLLEKLDQQRKHYLSLNNPSTEQLESLSQEIAFRFNISLYYPFPSWIFNTPKEILL